MTHLQIMRLVLAQICVHGATTGSRLAAPLLALQLGRSAAEVGVLLALFALAPVFLAIPAGRLADRRGMRLPLALAVGAAMLAGGLVAAWPRYLVLCAAALLAGAASGTAQITLQRHVARAAATRDARRTAFSWMAIAPAASNFAGPLLAGLLIDHAQLGANALGGYRAAYAVLALLPLLCWLLVWTLRELPPNPQATSQRPPPVWSLLKRPALRRALLANWLGSSAWDLHTFILPLLGHERGLSASSIGLLLGTLAVAAALMRLMLPLVSRRLSEAAVLLICSLIAAAVLALYPLAPGVLTMGACSALLGAALGAVQPMVLNLLALLAPPERQGEAMALRSVAMNSSSFAMPVLFGLAGGALGTAGLFWLMAAVQAAGSRAVAGLGRMLSAPEAHTA